MSGYVDCVWTCDEVTTFQFCTPNIEHKLRAQRHVGIRLTRNRKSRRRKRCQRTLYIPTKRSDESYQPVCARKPRSRVPRYAIYSTLKCPRGLLRLKIKTVSRMIKGHYALPSELDEEVQRVLHSGEFIIAPLQQAYDCKEDIFDTSGQRVSSLDTLRHAAIGVAQKSRLHPVWLKFAVSPNALMTKNKGIGHPPSLPLMWFRSSRVRSFEEATRHNGVRRALAWWWVAASHGLDAYPRGRTIPVLRRYQFVSLFVRVVRYLLVCRLQAPPFNAADTSHPIDVERRVRLAAGSDSGSSASHDCLLGLYEMECDAGSDEVASDDEGEVDALTGSLRDPDPSTEIRYKGAVPLPEAVLRGCPVCQCGLSLRPQVSRKIVSKRKPKLQKRWSSLFTQKHDGRLHGSTPARRSLSPTVPHTRSEYSLAPLSARADPAVDDVTLVYDPCTGTVCRDLEAYSNSKATAVGLVGKEEDGSRSERAHQAHVCPFGGGGGGVRARFLAEAEWETYATNNTMQMSMVVRILFQLAVMWTLSDDPNILETFLDDMFDMVFKTTVHGGRMTYILSPVRSRRHRHNVWRNIYAASELSARVQRHMMSDPYAAKSDMTWDPPVTTIERLLVSHMSDYVKSQLAENSGEHIAHVSLSADHAKGDGGGACDSGNFLEILQRLASTAPWEEPDAPWFVELQLLSRPTSSDGLGENASQVMDEGDNEDETTLSPKRVLSRMSSRGDYPWSEGSESDCGGSVHGGVTAKQGELATDENEKRSIWKKSSWRLVLQKTVHLNMRHRKAAEHVYSTHPASWGAVARSPVEVTHPAAWSFTPSLYTVFKKGSFSGGVAATSSATTSATTSGAKPLPEGTTDQHEKPSGASSEADTCMPLVQHEEASQAAEVQVKHRPDDPDSRTRAERRKSSAAGSIVPFCASDFAITTAASEAATTTDPAADTTATTTAPAATATTATTTTTAGGGGEVESSLQPPAMVLQSHTLDDTAAHTLEALADDDSRLFGGIQEDSVGATSTDLDDRRQRWSHLSLHNTSSHTASVSILSDSHALSKAHVRKTASGVAKPKLVVGSRGKDGRVIVGVPVHTEARAHIARVQPLQSQSGAFPPIVFSPTKWCRRYAHVPCEVTARDLMEDPAAPECGESGSTYFCGFGALMARHYRPPSPSRSSPSRAHSPPRPKKTLSIVSFSPGATAKAPVAPLLPWEFDVDSSAYILGHSDQPYDSHSRCSDYHDAYARDSHYIQHHHSYNSTPTTAHRGLHSANPTPQPLPQAPRPLRIPTAAPVHAVPRNVWAGVDALQVEGGLLKLQQPARGKVSSRPQEVPPGMGRRYSTYGYDPAFVPSWRRRASFGSWTTLASRSMSLVLGSVHSDPSRGPETSRSSCKSCETTRRGRPSSAVQSIPYVKKAASPHPLPVVVDSPTERRDVPLLSRPKLKDGLNASGGSGSLGDSVGATAGQGLRPSSALSEASKSVSVSSSVRWNRSGRSPGAASGTATIPSAAGHHSLGDIREVSTGLTPTRPKSAMRRPQSASSQPLRPASATARPHSAGGGGGGESDKGARRPGSAHTTRGSVTFSRPGSATRPLSAMSMDSVHSSGTGTSTLPRPLSAGGRKPLPTSVPSIPEYYKHKSKRRPVADPTLPPLSHDSAHRGWPSGPPERISPAKSVSKIFHPHTKRLYQDSWHRRHGHPTHSPQPPISPTRHSLSQTLSKSHSELGVSGHALSQSLARVSLRAAEGGREGVKVVKSEPRMRVRGRPAMITPDRMLTAPVISRSIVFPVHQAESVVSMWTGSDLGGSRMNLQQRSTTSVSSGLFYIDEFATDYVRGIEVPDDDEYEDDDEVYL